MGWISEKAYKDHIADSPGDNRQVHIFADQLKDDDKNTRDDLRDPERILNKRSLSEAVYYKHCHYGRRQEFSQIMNHIR